jgi:hypothetical protein
VLEAAGGAGCGERKLVFSCDLNLFNMLNEFQAFRKSGKPVFFKPKRQRLT